MEQHFIPIENYDISIHAGDTLCVYFPHDTAPASYEVEVLQVTPATITLKFEDGEELEYEREDDHLYLEVCDA